ncbi:hypothetical protein SDC9_208428 [bioreactor metagenome]|uniref:Uncharacterized protein n=1 Tax=bioreactor metagenome TaxID=1076179 RepID=A0A645JBJ1_9ZZZZ
MQHFFNFIQGGILTNNALLQQLHDFKRFKMKTWLANQFIFFRCAMRCSVGFDDMHGVIGSRHSV